MENLNFICNSCNFQAKTKYRFEYHMKTKRHKQMVEKSEKMVAITPPKPNATDSLHSSYASFNFASHPPSVGVTQNNSDATDSLRLSSASFNTEDDIFSMDFLHDNNALCKLFDNNTDISEYLNIIYDQAMNYNDFVNRVFVDYSDIIEIRNISQHVIINHKFVKLIYKILFKYLNELPIEKRPVHFHKTICEKFGRSRTIENWYIREQNKWRKLDPNICIGTLDTSFGKKTGLFGERIFDFEASLNAEFYDKIMRPLLIQCIFLWTIRCINPNSESDKKEHYELGIALNKFLSCCEKSYLGCNFEPEEEEETDASVEDASDENFDY